MSESKEINILAIESSCDETAAAVVRNGREVRSNIISSQIDLHKLYGGVVPEIAFFLIYFIFLDFWGFFHTLQHRKIPLFS